METKWSWKKKWGVVVLIAILSGLGVYGWGKYGSIDIWPANDQKVACNCGGDSKAKSKAKAKPKAEGNVKVTPAPKAASVSPPPAPVTQPSAMVDNPPKANPVWESPLVDGVDKNYGRAQAEFVPQEEEVVTTRTTFVEGVTNYPDNYERHDHRDWNDYHHERYESNSYYGNSSQSSFELHPVEMHLDPVPMHLDPAPVHLQPVNMSPPANSGGPGGGRGSNGPVNPAP